MTITPFFWGPERLVNTTTTNSQNDSEVTVLANGNYIVVWRDASNSGVNNDGVDIRAQMYDASGEPLGVEFVVNQTTAKNQTNPTITALDNGGFVIIFSDETLGATPGFDVLAQRFDAQGQALGAPTVVNSVSGATLAHVVALDTGGFIATWLDTSGADNNISVRRFNEDGTPFDAADIQVTNVAGNQSNPEVSFLAGGAFVVVWEDQDDTGTDRDIKAQIFNSDGTKNGGEFTANSTVTGTQTVLSVTTLANGNFVVAWQDGGSGDVSARIFDASGNEVFAEFDVSTSTGTAPQVIALDDGGFLIAWQVSLGQDIRIQRYDASGVTIGSTITVNTITTGNQRNVEFDITSDERVIMVWTDLSNGSVIRSQILSLTTDNIVGTSSDETINGNANANAIHGYEGNDIINGGAGQDTINAGMGDDLIIDSQNAAASNTDIIDGGDGIDTYAALGIFWAPGVTFNLSTGLQTVTSGTVRDTFANIENITIAGTASIIGDDMNNRLEASDILGAGDNTISGNGGSDILIGNGGNDTLNGGDQSDTLHGGEGNDILNGDAGADTINGGDGQDQLDGGNNNDMLFGGDDAFTFIGTGGFTNTAGEVRYAFGGSHTIVSADVDGDGVADFQIDLNGNINLLSNDFML